MDKKIINTVVGILVVGVGFLYYSQFDNDIKVAYIDVNLLLSEYQGMKDAQVEFQGQSKVWQANVDTLIAEWTRELQKFEKERASMTEKEQYLNGELLSTKQQQIQQYQQGVKQKIKEEEQKMNQTVFNQVNEYIKEFGEKKGYKYVLGANASGSLLYANEEGDITQEVLTGLNKEYKGN